MKQKKASIGTLRNGVYRTYKFSLVQAGRKNYQSFMFSRRLTTIRSKFVTTINRTYNVIDERITVF